MTFLKNKQHIKSKGGLMESKKTCVPRGHMRAKATNHGDTDADAPQQNSLDEEGMTSLSCMCMCHC